VAKVAANVMVEVEAKKVVVVQKFEVISVALL
jgi:hypothetical protein